MNYCVGFFFNAAMDMVVLIRKKKPSWQAGMLNGVGGKVENGESFRQGMVREFEEETGVKTVESDWKLAVEQRGEDYTLAVFHCVSGSNVCQDVIKADEQADWYRVKELPQRTDLIHNIPWLIFLAFDKQVRIPLQVFA